MQLTQRIKKTIKSWIDATLQRDHEHYACSLPKESGFLSTLILNSVFTDVHMNPTQAAYLKTLSEKGIIVYVSKYRSRFEYLFYHIRYKEEGVPFPEICFEYRILLWQKISRLLRIAYAHLNHLLKHRSFLNPYESGFFKRRLESGSSAFFSLIDPRGFYRRFVKAKQEPAAYLIELQKTIDRPIYIVPQWLFFSKKPHRPPRNVIDVIFGSEENPGRLRRWAVVLRSPQRLFVEVADPLNLKDFLKEPENEDRELEQVASDLRNRLLDQLDRHRQSITGPVLKTPLELKELILRDEEVQHFMRHYAESQNKDVYDIYKEANSYLDDIAADYNVTLVQTLAKIFGWIWKTMFEDVTVDMEGLYRVKSAATRAPLVIVPCHKSHFDYLIINYLLFTNNMPTPHIAAGRNLAFWPMGPLFRKSGAFFIRRTFRGAKLYSAIFARYVHQLIKQGVNIEFFIEGGRSRTGKLVLPKTGLVSILLDAFKNGVSRDLIFVPVFVGYDRLLEESAILKELEGVRKKEESFWELIRARKVLKKRHGRVYVQFADPISLRTLVSNVNPSLEDMTQAEFQAFGRNLSHRIINAINDISVVTAQALTASAILNCPKPRFSHDEIMVYVDIYLNYLLSQNVRLSENIADPYHGVENVLSMYEDRKFIGKQKTKKQDDAASDEEWYLLAENKRLNLEYYKNNCIHFFVPAAYTAMAILSYDAFQFSASALHSDYELLQEFFKYEFAYDVDKTSAVMVRKTLKAFIDDAILIPHRSLPDTYNITATGFRKLLCFASFLKTYFESYWVVLKVLKAHHKGELVKKECMKRIRALGNQLYKQQEIERPEALSQINYENGLMFFNFKGIRGAEDEEQIEFYTEVIQKYLRCFTTH